MNRAVLNSMSDAEQRLVAETSSAALVDPDEEEPLDLEARIRRQAKGDDRVDGTS